MTDAWQYAIPFTLTGAAILFYLLCEKFWDKEQPIAYMYLGASALLLLDAVFAVHQVATDTLNPPVVATRVGYILVLVFFGLSFLYFIIRGFQHKAEEAMKTGSRFRK